MYLLYSAIDGAEAGSPLPPPDGVSFASMARLGFAATGPTLGTSPVQGEPCTDFLHISCQTVSQQIVCRMLLCDVSLPWSSRPQPSHSSCGFTWVLSYRVASGCRCVEQRRAPALGPRSQGAGSNRRPAEHAVPLGSSGRCRRRQQCQRQQPGAAAAVHRPSAAAAGHEGRHGRAEWCRRQEEEQAGVAVLLRAAPLLINLCSCSQQISDCDGVTMRYT